MPCLGLINLAFEETLRRHRLPQAGLSILEVMISFLAASLFSIGILVAITSLQARQDRALALAYMTDYARGILDEYQITYPAMAKAGEFDDRWDWAITDNLSSLPLPSSSKPYVELRTISISVVDRYRQDYRVTLRKEFLHDL